MTSNKLLFVLLMGIFAVACKKNDDSQITYPSVYRKSGMKPVGELRLFSSNGEIRDPLLLSRFSIQDSADFKSYSDNVRDNPGIMSRINFRDPHQVVLDDSYLERNCLVIREKSRMILTGTDTIVGYSHGDEFTRSPSYYILQIKPDVYTEYIISSTRGSYQFGYTGRDKFILDRHRGQVVAPFIVFTLRGQQQWYTSFVNNVLQDDFYKNIPAGDTITLKEYMVLYDK